MTTSFFISLHSSFHWIFVFSPITILTWFVSFTLYIKIFFVSPLKNSVVLFSEEFMILTQESKKIMTRRILRGSWFKHPFSGVITSDPYTSFRIKFDSFLTWGIWGGSSELFRICSHCWMKLSWFFHTLSFIFTPYYRALIIEMNLNLNLLFVLIKFISFKFQVD